MFREKVSTLIYHEAELLATSSPNDVCCDIYDDDITEDYLYIPENKYYMKNLPYQEGPIEWHTTNGRFWMRGKISQSSKITITLCKSTILS